MNDERTITAIKNRNEAAINEVITKYSKLLWAVAGAVLNNMGSTQDVEECVADTFIYLWEHPDKYDPQRGKLKTWLSIVARTQAVNRCREISKRNTISLENTDFIDQLGVVDNILEAETRKSLIAAVNALGEPDREILIRRYAKHDRAEFVRVVQEAQSSQQTAEVRKQRTRLATAKQRVSELEVLLCKIYEDNILGKLSDSRYATLDAQYEKEQSELTAEISVLEKAVKSYEKHEKDADRFIALIDKYENFDKLTIAMLNEFIEKILVHERDRKGSIQTTQEVEIYFNFVGRFVPPAFGEVELTPEELEEIRKREERKDRLHQNYLKRKASGAQKRYEDKIKKRKKAEIEAKKAAIRAEDIAKGVFVPVSSLPQREPMKGVQTA